MFKMALLGFIKKPVGAAVSNWGYRIINIGTQLLCMRMLIGSLGVEGYGVIAILAGLIPLYAVADFGLGNGSIKSLAVARNKGEDFATLGLVCIKISHYTVFVLFLLVLACSPWVGKWLLHSANFMSEKQQIVLFILASMFYLHQAIIQLIVKLFYSEGSGVLVNMVLAAGSVLTMIAVWLYLKHSSPSLLGAIIALNAPASVIGIVLAMIISLRYKRALPLLPELDHRRTIVPLLSRGINFWLIAVGAMLMSRAEMIILSQSISDPAIATRYRLISSLGMFVFMLFTSMLQAVSPLLALEASAGRLWRCEQIGWQLIKSSAILVVLAIGSIIVFKSSILELLSPGNHMEIDSLLFILFGAYVLVRVWCDTFANLLVSSDHFRTVLIVTIPAVIIGPVAQFILCQHYGLSGLIVGVAMPYLLTQVVPLWLSWRNVKSKDSDVILVK